MTDLSGFEDAAADALAEEAEAFIADTAEQLKDDAEANFKRYASANDYSIDHIWRDAVLSSVERRGNTATARVEWPELTALFEYGVDPFTLSASGDQLAFLWESPPEGTRPSGAPSFVQTESVNWGSVTGGIDEARAIRNAMDVARLRLGGSVTR